MTKSTIGIIGLGRMGAAIAARLAERGSTVSAWSRRGVTAEEAAGLGITAVPDLASLAAVSDILILCLMDDAAVHSVLGGIETLDLSGRLVVDTSTVSPDTLRAHAKALEAAGARAIDAPIAGGPDLIKAGRVGLYLGGEAVDIARFRPVAEDLSDRIHHVGPLGHGAAAKLVNNMMLLGLWQTLKEALLLGEASGLSRDTMLSFLESSPAASPAFKSRLPVMRGESDVVGFSLSGAVKDARVVADLAERQSVDLPAINAARRSFEAAEAAGHGEADLATMIRVAHNGKD